MTPKLPQPPGVPGVPTVIDLESIALVVDERGPRLTLRGRGQAPSNLTLKGARLVLEGAVEPDAEGWSGELPLLASRWGGSALPPPSGSYLVNLSPSGPDREHPAVTGRAGGSVRVPDPQLVPGMFRLAFRVEDSNVFVIVTPPLTDDELGGENQARLETDYRAARPEPENAVFFESFYGQNASCNPLALDRELATARPDIARYWGVSDASVAVPPGAIRVIEGSTEWWRVRAAAKLLIVNDWLRNRYRTRPHQKVLQTWHGTMLKRLALSRKRPGIRPALATLRERGRWSILLAQNDYAKRIFRRSYAFAGPIWEEGYPRDDILVTGDRAAIRARLGIPDGARVVLYAPTWRDDRPNHVDHLDVSTFSAQLGEGWVTLIRGHSRTLQPGEDVCAGGVIDVTSYPDISDLFLAADALVTDYSSVMFDFSVTGKPIYFFTPDIDRYREVLRGFYFDLLPVAPGPVVHDPARLVELVKNPDAVRDEFAEKYAAWRERFNPLDDGRAAHRVVARLLREGIL